MKKFLDGYYAFLKIALTILMGVLIVPVTMQIFARYIDFIPRMIALRENEHFTVDLLPTPKTNRGKAISLLVVDLMTFILAAIFVVWGWPLVQFGLLQTSEMAELPMVFIYMAWPLTGITWILFLAERLNDHIRLYRSDAA
jgi:TRAP-type C4-dicarboxylate transport system permease small subunit